MRFFGQTATSGAAICAFNEYRALDGQAIRPGARFSDWGWGAYSIQVFITTRAPWRSVICAAGQRATAAR
jgi:hypothetical protein